MTNNEKDQSPAEKLIGLDLDKLKASIPGYTSEKLCAMIVCDRYFGFGQEMTVACMQELAARRIGGDNFEFEKYIEEALAKLPPLNFGVPDLRATLTSMTKKGK
jgi:hypothetical protein